MTEDIQHIDRRVTRVETTLEQHIKVCGEQSRRTADNLAKVQESISQLRNSLDRGLARLHGRLEKSVHLAWGFVTITLVTIVGWLLANSPPWG